MASVHEDRDICTISNEAFAILVLENQYDWWTDIYNNKLDMPVQAVTGHAEKEKCKWESNLGPKYTNGGILYRSDKWRMTHKGWKEAPTSGNSMYFICKSNMIELITLLF
jgi:hypothetical protein